MWICLSRRLVYLFPSSGGGHGLTGEYSQHHVQRQPGCYQGRLKVNFWWLNFGNGIPLPAAYGVRWSGKLVAPGSGRFAFQVNHNSICRLFINDEMIIESHKPVSNDMGAQVKPLAYKEFGQGSGL